MTDAPNADRARFPRREFLVGSAAMAAVGALGAVVLHGLPSLMRAASQPLPDFVYASGAVKSYRIALNNPDLLLALPCYCGCVSYQPPHHNLRDCFLRPQGGFEAHAAGCSTCQQEALDAQRWADAGLPLTEVRRRLDAAYHDRGPSTDTPA